MLIAPTRLLVEQHLRTLGTLYQGLGVRVEQLTSALPPRERRRILDAVANGEIDIVVGTQAAVLPPVAFRRLSIGVVDEQHRFGVRQRSALLEKGAESVLIASATPIPRTMAQALYGGIEISVLDERPPGREPVSSHWIHPERWDDLLRFIRQRIERSEQIFVVCPYIEADDERGEVGAVGMWERLAASLGKEHVDLVHGRMSDEEQSRVMTRFAHGERSVLVATSVVEVGVDVPNATVMIVESAHLFGLAQLHQLRGRVGRGNRPGYAFFVSEGPTASARKRLDQLRRCDDGFKLAEYDLWARGPGEYAGLRQWGASDLRFVDLARDLNLFPQIRDWWGERASAIALERWIDSWPPLLRSYLTPADEDLAPVE